MFKTGQMLTASALVRNFPKVSRFLQRAPQALLITQITGEHLVLVNAEIFEDLLAERVEGMGGSGVLGDIRTELNGAF